MRTALLLIALSACNGSPPPAPAAPAAQPGAIADPGEVVLTVNGMPVGKKELDLVFRRMKVPADQLDGFAWTTPGKHVAEEYALARVLYQKALDEKLYDDPEVAMQLAFAERQILGSAMREKLAHDAVNDAAVQKYYEENKDRFTKPEVHARQIQVADETLARELGERLKKGEDFAQLAKDHSTDQLSKRVGGDVGWFHEHENPLYGDAAFGAPVGTIVGPIQSRVGWHIVEVLGKRDATPLEDVKPEAEQQIEHKEGVRIIEEMRNQMKLEWVKAPEGGPELSAPPEGAVATPGEPPPGGPGAGMPPNHPGGGGDGPPPHGKVKAKAKAN